MQLFNREIIFLPPPCPACGGQPATDRRIIIILVVALIIMTALYVSDYRIKPWNIYCTQNPISTVNVRNNMQASHTYTDGISNRDSLMCIKADDHGSLWGSSMQPTFFEGNTVLLKDYNTTTTLHTGDIVRYFRYDKVYTNCTVIAALNNNSSGAYVNNTMAVIHRINAIYNDRIVVQGDNLYDIENIDRCQIVDVAVGIIFT